MMYSKPGHRRLDRLAWITGGQALTPSLVVIFVFLLLVQSPDVAVCKEGGAASEETGQTATGYPQTPAGVIEAFVKAGLADLPEGVRLDLHGIALKAQQSVYMPTNEERDFREKTGLWEPYRGYGRDPETFHISTGFQIVEAIEHGQTTATVKVRYRRIGSISGFTPFYLAECRGRYSKTGEKDCAPTSVVEAIAGIASRQGPRPRDDEPCRIVRVTNDTYEVSYHLEKLDDKWRIVCRYQQHMSPASAVKLLKFWVTAMVPGLGRRYASEQQAAELTEDIRVLEQYMWK